MRKPEPTSHDVARRAGVSRATVSIVLSGSQAAVISQETREKVRRAADELGYRPHAAARTLKSGATRVIGLLVSGRHAPQVDGFLPILFHAIGEELRGRNYHVLVETLAQDAGDPYADLIRSRRIDGLLLLNPPAEDPSLAALIESGFPAVMVGRSGHPEEWAVHTRGRAALFELTRRLVEKGRRNFGAVMLSAPGLAATDRRRAALEAALAAHGLGFAPGAVVCGDFSAESGHAAARALMEARPETDAIFAGNDTLAIGVLSALAARGLKVPQDVSVAGYDDLPFAAWLTPALTTIRADAALQGRLAARLLIDRLEGASDPARLIALEGELVWRASC